MSLAAPFQEGEAGPDINPTQRWVNYLMNDRIYEAMGLKPSYGSGISSPLLKLLNLPSRTIGTGMGYGPASLAGTSSIPSAEALIRASTIPTLASRSLTNGMGYGPASLAGTGMAAGAMNAGVNAASNAAGNMLGNAGKNLLNSATDSIPEWARAAIAAMSGLPALLAQQGPSDEEKAYADQARRLLAQQEQRTQFQSPLYEAVTRMAWNLQPNSGNNNGSAYPINSLTDVKVPGYGA